MPWVHSWQSFVFILFFNRTVKKKKKAWSKHFVERESREFKSCLFQWNVFEQGIKPLHAVLHLLTQEKIRIWGNLSSPNEMFVFILSIFWNKGSVSIKVWGWSVLSFTLTNVLDHFLSCFSLQQHPHLYSTWLKATCFCDMPEPTEECVILHNHSFIIFFFFSSSWTKWIKAESYRSASVKRSAKWTYPTHVNGHTVMNTVKSISTQGPLTHLFIISTGGLHHCGVTVHFLFKVT